MNVPVLWRELGRALAKRVIVIPLPRAVIFVAMLFATLGWKPRHAFDAALSHAAEGYRRAGWL